jgi:hypothetical protein
VLCDRRKHVTDHQTALAPRPKRPVFLPQQAHLAKEDVDLLIGLKRAAMQPAESRLVIKGVDVAQTAHKADLNGPLRLGPRAGDGRSAG